MALKVMSFNVRTSAMDDKDGDNRWDNRKATVAGIVANHRPAVCGMQEPHKHQVEYLAENLPDYGWVGDGRCPVIFGLGEEHCEYNPIFYDRSQVELVSNGQFWLSDMPEIPNTRFEGAAFPRICVWARLKRLSDGAEFTFINTHFDHEGEEPRLKSAKLILERLADITGGTPTILVGDLNAGAETQCYQVLTGALADSTCVDGCCTAEGLLPNGTSTFCGFNEDIDSVIDFIFVGQGATATNFGVVPDKQPNGCCASDHKPIVAEVSF